MFLWKKKVSEEKFSKCKEGKKKNVSVEFRVFGKKELKEKVPRGKKIKVIWGGNFAEESKVKRNVGFRMYP